MTNADNMTLKNIQAERDYINQIINEKVKHIMSAEQTNTLTLTLT